MLAYRCHSVPMTAHKNFTGLVSYVKVALLIDEVLGVLDFNDRRILLVLY